KWGVVSWGAIMAGGGIGCMGRACIAAGGGKAADRAHPTSPSTAMIKPQNPGL
ncbi:MAG: hypothetical protein JWM11_6963, partial [Planctomycetaceae bacterium]|nr:hypothetical protein [Planctomycetaceae bacterium]